MGPRRIPRGQVHLAGLAALSESLRPNPNLTPEQVVGVLLDALQRNDEPEPDAGIATLYAFAAPKLRRQVGSFETFRRVMHNPRYAPLLGHGESDLGELMRLGDSARQALTVVSSGWPVPYLFALVQSETGEWLLSGISRPDALE